MSGAIKNMGVTGRLRREFQGFVFFLRFFFSVVFLIVVLMCVEQFGSCFASVLVKLISLTYLIKSESYL